MILQVSLCVCGCVLINYSVVQSEEGELFLNRKQLTTQAAGLLMWRLTLGNLYLFNAPPIIKEQDWHQQKYASKYNALSRLIIQLARCTDGTVEATPLEVTLMSFNQGGIAKFFVLVGEMVDGHTSNSASPSDSETTFGDGNGDGVTRLDIVGDDVGISKS